MVARPNEKKRGFIRSEWLKGEVNADDVESEALNLLADPRDSISHVQVWSLTENQFAWSYSRNDLREELAAA